LQDLALDYGIVAESFETSVPWDKCQTLCDNVKAVVREECKKHGIDYYLISCRVTQTYDAGACVYFYFGFRYNIQTDPVATYEEIENKARDEILASGMFAFSINMNHQTKSFSCRRFHFASSWRRQDSGSVVQAKHFSCRRQFVQISQT